MAAIRIVDYALPDESHNYYDVYFYSDRIQTLVTHDPQMVANWISDTEFIHRSRLSHLIVGLDVEWRPNFSRHYQNPVAVLQLCVGRRCLIFQVLHCTETYNYNVPEELIGFLSEEQYTFVGVGIVSDAEKLEDDYGIRIGGNMVDLRDLAADAYAVDGLKHAGLKELTRVVLGRDVQKPRRVTMGRWDNRWLNHDQVKYACIDAFVSFEIGRRLNASN